jgi:CHAT domain-containing protein
MKGFRFGRLPNTREEVRAIHGLIGEDKAESYLGKKAREGILRSKGAPWILHLATHGFFLSDLEMVDMRHKTANGTTLSEDEDSHGEPPGRPFKIENPLLRSGIALAGANRALESSDNEQSDGILTSEKILGLRLRGTDMVVLSACETGVGEVKNGEGIYGLRRAFTQAGARSLVMSMWKVRDRETKELMVSFYKNILSGMNRCQALRQAALNEMKTVKSRYGTAHPFFWGGFVFMGEP